MGRGSLRWLGAVAVATSIAMTGCSAAPDATWSVAVQPQDEGRALLDAIGSAQESVDIVVYQLDSPQVTAALVDAMRRGVAVRLLLDGHGGSQQSRNRRAAQEIHRAAVDAGLARPPLQAHYSSENFSITHQKTAIVDAAGNGSPTALVSTGNFSEYRGQPFYGPRDFYLTTHAPSLIAQAWHVFNSDFRCDGRFVTNGLLDTAPLIWSNGTTELNQGDPAGAYPLAMPTRGQPYFGYFDLAHQNPPTGRSGPLPTVQGGTVGALQSLIQSADNGDVLRIYNEEQSSEWVNEYLAAAVGRGVDVRIVESFEDPRSSKKIANLVTLATVKPRGARVNIMAPDSAPGSLYIHAKVVSLEPVDGSPLRAYVGSSNFSDPSMQANRELGALLGDADQVQIQEVNAVFDRDFSIADPALAYMITMDNRGAGLPTAWSSDSRPDTDAPGTGSVKPTNARCGPIPGVSDG